MNKNECLAPVYYLADFAHVRLGFDTHATPCPIEGHLVLLQLTGVSEDERRQEMSLSGLSGEWNVEKRRYFPWKLGFVEFVFQLVPVSHQFLSSPSDGTECRGVSSFL
jgi:hypothetical protein